MNLREPHVSWADDELVRECINGNQLAWAVLVEKYKNLVYSIPSKYQLPREDAADIFQYVWTELYRNLTHLDRVGGLRKWLITTAGRRSLLYKKRLVRNAQMPDLDREWVDETPDISALQSTAERDQQVRDAIANLPPRCARMIQMLFFEDPPMPYQEVARTLGLAEGSIGFIRGRCLKKLRMLLEEFGS